MAWNPQQYLKFSATRLRPAVDLVARAAAFCPDPSQVKTVLDLGCGPGNVTEVLCHTFPRARIIGVDSSDTMIARAIEMHKSAPYKERLQFKVATVEDECEKGAEKYDIVFSNSSLHWCLDHAKLFPDLVRNIVNPNGGVLAVQMPDTQQQRSHVLMDIAAFRSGQLDRLLDVRIPRAEQDGSWYFDLMSPLIREIDIWNAEYMQQLPMQPPSYTDSHHPSMKFRHPVLEFTRSTGLKPIIEALGGEEDPNCQQYLREYEILLSDEFPSRVVKNSYHSQGKHVILMPFKRLFIVCKT